MDARALAEDLRALANLLTWIAEDTETRSSGGLDREAKRCTRAASALDAQAARVAELEKAALAVMAWWKDHEFDAVSDGDGDERNVYDEDPEMVVLARLALTPEAAKESDR